MSLSRKVIEWLQAQEEKPALLTRMSPHLKIFGLGALLIAVACGMIGMIMGLAWVGEWMLKNGHGQALAWIVFTPLGLLAVYILGLIVNAEIDHGG